MNVCRKYIHHLQHSYTHTLTYHTYIAPTHIHTIPPCHLSYINLHPNWYVTVSITTCVHVLPENSASSTSSHCGVSSMSQLTGSTTASPPSAICLTLASPRRNRELVAAICTTLAPFSTLSTTVRSLSHRATQNGTTTTCSAFSSPSTLARPQTNGAHALKSHAPNCRGCCDSQMRPVTTSAAVVPCTRGALTMLERGTLFT